MDGENRVREGGLIQPDDARPSYWLDACEDMSCDLIDDYANFDSTVIHEPIEGSGTQDSGMDPCFFGGIDLILDSIKNGSGLPPVTGGDTAIGIGVGATIKDLSTACNGAHKLQGDCYIPTGNAVHRPKNIRGIDFDEEERRGKRARLSNYKNDRLSSGKRTGRKKPRNWEELDNRRDEGQNRRRDHVSINKRENRDRDWRGDREVRGYWERHRLGSKEMVFHLGSWEVDRSSEGKTAVEKHQEFDKRAEKKLEETKEKNPEEQARQYQLDVLEQAKKRNTIAFLETGAGKTLIAVLLIKSVCNDLLTRNKKVLAVFLVPKVPLVYQVVHFNSLFAKGFDDSHLMYRFCCCFLISASRSYTRANWLPSWTLLW